MELIRKIVISYGIKPQIIDKITDTVYRIDDGQQLYALKRSALTNETITMWENIYHQAQNHHLAFILPVYLTKQKSLYKEVDQSYYYLTPWQGGKQPTIEQFYRSIGKIHAKTMKSQSINNKQMIRQFSSYKSFCENTKVKLLTYVKRFERNRYMSPFELQVCTHYRDIEFVLKKMIERIDQLIDDQNEISTWKYCLCHGNLALSHLFVANQTYIINWEKAYYGNSTSDLVMFFKNQVTSYDTDTESFINSFSNYMDENKLNNNELFLLVIHLLDPTEYITMIQQYIDKKPKTPMIKQVKDLQYTYRQLLFGLEFSKHVEKEFETMLIDDLEN